MLLRLLTNTARLMIVRVCTLGPMGAGARRVGGDNPDYGDRARRVKIDQGRSAPTEQASANGRGGLAPSHVGRR